MYPYVRDAVARSAPETTYMRGKAVGNAGCVLKVWIVYGSDWRPRGGNQTTGGVGGKLCFPIRESILPCLEHPGFTHCMSLVSEIFLGLLCPSGSKA